MDTNAPDRHAAALSWMQTQTVPKPGGGKLANAGEMAKFAGDVLNGPADGSALAPSDCPYCSDDGSQCPGCGANYDGDNGWSGMTPVVDPPTPY